MRATPLRRREVTTDPHDGALLNQTPGPSASSGDEVDQRLHLQRVLAGLAPRQRAVIVLRYYLDLSEAETATTLGCSVGTVKSQAAKGAARLRNSITAASSTKAKEDER